MIDSIRAVLYGQTRLTGFQYTYTLYLSIALQALAVDIEFLVRIAEAHDGTWTHGLIEFLGVT